MHDLPKARPRQFIWLGIRQQLTKVDLGSLTLKYLHFTFSSSVLDQELTFVKYISLLCRSCYYQLRPRRVVSRSLTPRAASMHVHFLVVSHLDYCSAIYDGLLSHQLRCLDRVPLTPYCFWVAFLSSTGSRDICRTSFPGSPTQQCIVYPVSELVP